MARECNVGGLDRSLRLGLGTGLLVAGIAAPINKWLKFSAGALGTMGLVTGATHYCPVSKALGKNTCVNHRELKTESEKPDIHPMVA